MMRKQSLEILTIAVLFIGALLMFAACDGSGSSSDEAIFDFTTSSSSVMNGPAYYLDLDLNSFFGFHDRIVIPFNSHISISNPLVSDFSLPVNGDSFGSNVGIFAGQGPNEITISVGHLASIKTRGLFDSTRTQAGAPSGLDASQGIDSKALQSLTSVFINEPVDIVPGFVVYSRMLGLGDTHALALGDLNNDGLLDVVEGNFGANEVWLYRCDKLPANTFQALGNNDTTSLALADLDGDGDLDIVEGNAFQRNTVWMNDGTASFQSSIELSGLFDTRALATADVDRDGDIDIVEANYRQANRVLLNDGNGGFTDSGQALGDYDTESIVAHDMDRDGDIDLVTGNYAQPNRIWINNGSGIFTDSGWRLGTGKTRSIVAADVDNDGDADLIEGNDGEANRILLNRDEGISMAWEAGQEFGNSATRSLVALDIDGDGAVDLVEGCFEQADHAWFNDGTGLFTRCEQVINEEKTQALVAGDMDGDGDLDIMAGFAQTSGSMDRNLIYLNSLSGTWGPSAFSDSGQSWFDSMTSGEMADLDDDGDLDIVAFGNSRYHVLLYNEYTGFHYLAQQVFVSGGPQAGMALADLDRDGDIDVAGNRILLNSGDGFFTAGQAFSQKPVSVAIGDVDRDGDPDLVHGLAGGQGNLVWLNNGFGLFTDSGQTLGSADTTAVVPADVDREGDIDIIEGVLNAGNRVWINTGAGLFADSGLSLGDNATRTLALIDEDSDGDIDFVEGIDGAPAQVWYNVSGASTIQFVAGMTIGSDPAPFVLTGDVDGDGYEDVIASSGDVATGARLHRFNRYAQQFMGDGEALGFNTAPLDLGDIDRDGSLDLLVGGDANSSVTIWFND